MKLVIHKTINLYLTKKKRLIYINCDEYVVSILNKILVIFFSKLIQNYEPI